MMIYLDMVFIRVLFLTMWLSITCGDLVMDLDMEEVFTVFHMIAVRIDVSHCTILTDEYFYIIDPLHLC